MASIGEWVKQAKFDNVANLTTPDVYSQIKRIGLKTVNWNSFSPRENVDLDDMLTRMDGFIMDFSPCLFIWDPKFQGKKDYLFNVLEVNKVCDWVSSNKPFDYSYLITTLISSCSGGYVGTIMSDGKGKLFCETYHEPGVSNHRVLSQSKTDESKLSYFCRFFSQDFELASLSGQGLNESEINYLLKTFSFEKGYFEFVRGMHLNKPGVYVTGFESNKLFNVPNSHVAFCESGNRWRAEMIRHYKVF